MFLEPGRVNSKRHRASGRIYNISGMPSGSYLIYSGCNRFPASPIRKGGEGIHRVRHLDTRTSSAVPRELAATCRNRTRADADGIENGVDEMGCTLHTLVPKVGGDQCTQAWIYMLPTILP
jgi:hypothetical protein